MGALAPFPRLSEQFQLPELDRNRARANGAHAIRVPSAAKALLTVGKPRSTDPRPSLFPPLVAMGMPTRKASQRIGTHWSSHRRGLWASAVGAGHSGNISLDGIPSPGFRCSSQLLFGLCVGPLIGRFPMPTVVSQWKLRRLASRALRIVKRCSVERPDPGVLGAIDGDPQ